MWALVGLFRIRLKIQRREKPFECQILAILDDPLGLCKIEVRCNFLKVKNFHFVNDIYILTIDIVFLVCMYVCRWVVKMGIKMKFLLVHPLESILFGANF